MDVYTIFEFLSIHFQIIHFQNKKKKFVKWFSSVFLNDSITQKSPNFFYRDESTKTIVVNITTQSGAYLEIFYRHKKIEKII